MRGGCSHCCKLLLQAVRLCFGQWWCLLPDVPRGQPGPPSKGLLSLLTTTSLLGGLREALWCSVKNVFGQGCLAATGPGSILPPPPSSSLSLI